MHNFNTPSGSQYMTENRWNNPAVNSEIAQNAIEIHHDYYESKMVFARNESGENLAITRNDLESDNHLSDAISFLNSDTALLSKTEQEPVSVRVVWNLLENVSRVYLPKLAATDDKETVCLSVKGDPYSVRENGVMLDALNYVRMLFSEQARAFPAY
ncbi:MULTISPECIES: hypothetical protein [Asaia]|uniref:hypothetical protein n=1 Tax=Asaia TaxID=91914 RepID=UPI002FC3BBBB